MFRRFQTKLVLFYITLFAAVQVITLLTVYTVTTHNVYTQIQDQLRYASRIFKLQIEDRSHKHAQAARILAADFGFRDAVTAADPATVQSAIGNLGARIKADRVLLVSLDNQTVADTQHPHVPAGKFAYASLIATAEEHDEAVAMVVMDGAIYEMVVVPVLAPTPVAWLVIGARIDDTLAANLKALSPLELDLSFAHREGADWRVAATTLGAERRQTLAGYLRGAQFVADQPDATALGLDNYMALVTPLAAPENGATVVAVLQYALAAGLRPYQPLLLWLLALTGTGLLVSLVGGMLIARSVTKPVRTLAEAAQRLEQGDYTQTVRLTQRDEVGQLAAAFNHMTARIAEREERIRHQAQHDAVTGLPNRMLFEVSVRETIASLASDSAGCSVVLVYIDRFAEIRNTLGHEVSDRLIRHVGDRLRAAIKQTDTLARLATDEFVLLTLGTEEDAVRVIAERLLGVFDASFNIDGVSIDVGAHLGVACYPAHGADADTLLKHADVAISSARRSLRRYAVYDAQSDIYTRRRLSLMSELRQGLERNELQLYYQPLIDLASDRATHVEALVRWQHPTNGFLPPDEFIPLAEQSGHIQRLTAWCLERAIEQCSAWRKAGIALTVAVNLSARDLPNRRLPGLIAELLHRHDAQAHWLTLEITESALMQEPEQALQVLRSLKDMGMRIAIDDFGTGYSSMAYLKKLPVDELKIDKSFVLGLASSAEDEIIVRSIIDLGHNLGLKVTAEGVEDEAALEILRRYGCDKTQGFLFSRPQPVLQLDHWLAVANRDGVMTTVHNASISKHAG